MDCPAIVQRIARRIKGPSLFQVRKGATISRRYAAANGVLQHVVRSRCR